MQTESCPRTSSIDRYLQGQLPEDQSRQLEDHLDACQSCGDTLRGLAQQGSDTLTDILSRPQPTGVSRPPQSMSGDEPVLTDLMAQLSRIGPSELAQRIQLVEDRAAEVMWLLQPDPTGETLGALEHYQLKELLGSGSTGVVFVARDQRLQRDVALKILRPSLGPTARQRFLNEARAAAGFQHEHIVTVFDVGEAQGLAYITMQLHPGETLEDRLERVTFLPEIEVRRVGEQVARALSLAHRRGVVHRDLKPANIWVDADSQQLKLLDFGLARVADADPHLTASGVLAGTPNYMSPEQTRGLELDGRSDLFSLGCVLYRCMTGRLPFGSTGILSTLQAIQNELPAPPKTVNSLCSVELSALIMCLLEKQPDRRPNSAEDVLHALAHPQVEWRFPIPNLSTPTSEQPKFTATASSIGHGRVTGWRWISLVATALAGVLGIWFFGADIVRVVTNQGEIVVESDSDQVQVEVTQNGNVVRVIDLATADRIELAAGTYRVQAGQAAGEFSITPDSVTLARGGRQIVRITRNPLSNPLPRSAISNKAEQIPIGSETTYKRMSFDQWLNVLQTDRHPDTYVEAIDALAHLSKDSPENRRVTQEVVVGIMREHGGYIMDGSPAGKIRAALLRFASSLSDEEVLATIHREIREGNTRSRQFLIMLMLAGSLLEDESNHLRMEPYLEALRQESESFCRTWAAALQTAVDAQDQTNIQSLGALGAWTGYWHQGGILSSQYLGIFGRKPGLVDNTLPLAHGNPLLKRLKDQWRNCANLEAKLILADCLSVLGSPDKEVTADLAERLRRVDADLVETGRTLALLSKHPQLADDDILSAIQELDAKAAKQPIEISIGEFPAIVGDAYATTLSAETGIETIEVKFPTHARSFHLVSTGLHWTLSASFDRGAFGENLGGNSLWINRPVPGSEYLNVSAGVGQRLRILDVIRGWSKASGPIKTSAIQWLINGYSLSEIDSSQADTELVESLNRPLEQWSESALQQLIAAALRSRAAQVLEELQRDPRVTDQSLAHTPHAGQPPVGPVANNMVQPPASVTNPGSSEQQVQATYDGKSFDQWFQILQVEKNLKNESLNNAIAALKILADDEQKMGRLQDFLEQEVARATPDFGKVRAVMAIVEPRPVVLQTALEKIDGFSEFDWTLSSNQQYWIIIGLWIDPHQTIQRIDNHLRLDLLGKSRILDLWLDYFNGVTQFASHNVRAVKSQAIVAAFCQLERPLGLSFEQFVKFHSWGSQNAFNSFRDQLLRKWSEDIVAGRSFESRFMELSEQESIPFSSRQLRRNEGTHNTYEADQVLSILNALDIRIDHLANDGSSLENLLGENGDWLKAWEKSIENTDQDFRFYRFGGTHYFSRRNLGKDSDGGQFVPLELGLRTWKMAANLRIKASGAIYVQRPPLPNLLETYIRVAQLSPPEKEPRGIKQLHERLMQELQPWLQPIRDAEMAASADAEEGAKPATLELDLKSPDSSLLLTNFGGRQQEFRITRDQVARIILLLQTTIALERGSSK